MNTHKNDAHTNTKENSPATPKGSEVKQGDKTHTEKPVDARSS